ncbi:MAG: 5-Nucleotidase domain protein [Proteobacteria bacterium]|nr:5-Nucleotidase domain protein [Pseudomonadota bacterium]
MRHSLIALVVAVATLAGCATRPLEPVAVRVLAINDFHGNLKPPSGGIQVRAPGDPEQTVAIAAGGAEYLATALATLGGGHSNRIFVAAGDLVGASPLLSALFDDEPSVEALGLMGLEASAVGNHEFDKGAAHLLRLQHGGSAAGRGRRSAIPYPGARFQYLAASTVDERSGQTLLPAYYIKRFQGIPVAFIGLTLQATAGLVAPDGVPGLRFRDEAETVNQLVPELRRQGIEAIVVLLHEGGVPSGDYNECPGISGPLVDIVGKLDRAVDVIISGHTHRAYNCRIDGRLVTSADRYGTVVSAIDLSLDPLSGDVISARADNVIVRHDRFAKEPQQSALIARYEGLAGPLAGRLVGRLAAALPREFNAAGESALGQLIADAQLAATRAAGARLALTNPGGIRSGLAMPADGLVRYADLFAVQPFSNHLVTLTLSGVQLTRLLEQQWLNQPYPRILQVSRGFTYVWDAGRPLGQRIVPGSLRLDGQPIAPESRLRVTVNRYLASGGDNFTVLLEGEAASTGVMDVEALESYVKSHPDLRPGALERIRRMH